MASNVLQIFRITLGRGSSLQLAANATKSTITIPKTVLNRGFASNAASQGSKKGRYTLAALISGASCGYFLWATGQWQQYLPESCRVIDYQKVYNAIAATLEEDGYDDGSYGPVYVRLAWHASGTYDKDVGNGGSSKATMRFMPEALHGGNAGLHVARERLERVKQQFPLISYGDLWTLAGTCAIQEMGGPIISWRPGRVDGEVEDCTPDGRLPDGGNPDPKHPRDVFYRMGFNDQEIVALIGAHAIGRCHPDRSGFDGPWTNSPTGFSNFFFVELLGRKWVDKQWNGPKQFVDKETGQLMMLPADMAFAKDKEFRKWVEVYAKDEKKFFEDFAASWIKLIELGVKFPEGTPTYTFTPTS